LAESFLNEPTVEGEFVLCDLDKKGNVVVLRNCAPEDASEVMVLPGAELPTKVAASVNA